jgi:hypothetical protein
LAGYDSRTTSDIKDTLSLLQREVPQEYFCQWPEHTWNLIKLVTIGTGTGELPGFVCHAIASRHGLTKNILGGARLPQTPR